ncbi:MAG: class I SAM-dependent methyltransferase [Nitrospirota bacterium]
MSTGSFGEDNIRKRLREFYEYSSRYGAATSILLEQYGTDGHEVKDPTRFMVMYEGQMREIKLMISPGKDILDAGTGDGVLAGLLLKDAKAMTALDISLERIKRCAETYKNGHFVVGNAEELPFRGECFDYVVASEIIEHLIEPERFLSSSNHVLKRGGTLIISTPSPLFYENNIGEILKDQHLHTFSPRRLKSLLRKTGFKTAGIKGIGFKLRVRIPKSIAVIPRVFYAVIKRKRPKRGFVSPVSVELNLVSNHFLNNLYSRNKTIYRRIFMFLCLIGETFPSMASQVVIKAERAL